MVWNDLLFMHWPIAPGVLRSQIPAGLDLDLFDGSAWIGVVPFLMTDVRPSVLPRVLASRFPELNVRTYVRQNGRAGVWFFSLDAADRLTVWAARRFFHLPYHSAEMSCEGEQTVEYKSRRDSNPGVEFAGRYRPTGAGRHFAEGSLEHWLTARLCLFSVDRKGRIYRGDIQHPPWLLQPAEAEVQRNTMTLPLGIALPDIDPLLHFSTRMEVEASALIDADTDAIT